MYIFLFEKVVIQQSSFMCSPFAFNRQFGVMHLFRCIIQAFHFRSVTKCKGSLVVMHPLGDPEFDEVIDPIKLIALTNLIVELY